MASRLAVAHTFADINIPTLAGDEAVVQPYIQSPGKLHRVSNKMANFWTFNMSV
jgi:hypothetical protein